MRIYWEFIDNLMRIYLDFVRIPWEFADNSNVVRIQYESQVHTTVSPQSRLIITGLTHNFPWKFALRIQREISDNIFSIHWEFNGHGLITWRELHENSTRVQIWWECNMRAKFTPHSRHILIELSPDSHATFRDNSMRMHR